MKLGLTDDHLEQLLNGEQVEFLIPDLTTAGRNARVVIEQTDAGNTVEYINGLDLPDEE